MEKVKGTVLLLIQHLITLAKFYHTSIDYIVGLNDVFEIKP